MEFRELITSCMEERGINARDLAAAIGYTPAYLYDLMKGARRFNEETERKICDYLEIDKVYQKKTA